MAVVAFRTNVLQESIENALNKSKQPPQDGTNKKKSSILIESPKSKRRPKDCTSPRVHNPPPIAVARRNARERNRVKQVNNGFATLRQHIPNEIAEIYENTTSNNNNRATSKKLSKVETLRMAVEYIRSLEDLLSLHDGRDFKENAANISLASFPSPASSESLQNHSSSYEQSYFTIQSPLDDDDGDDSDPQTPLPAVSSHRYARIPGTNTFQLMMSEDEENVHPLTPNSDMLPQEDLHHHHQVLMMNNVEFVPHHHPQFVLTSHPHHHHHQVLSSPNNAFSESSSLSPDGDFVDVKYEIVQTEGGQFLYEQPMNAVAPSMEQIVDQKGNILIVATDPRQADIKQEEERVDEEEDEEMQEVMTWWETEGRHEDEET